MMRRALLILGVGSVAVLLLGAALLLALPARRHASVPEGATDVRVAGWQQRQGVVCQRVTYHMPPAWQLFDQYAFLQARGLARDAVADQALRRTQGEWQSSTFAVFAGQSWLGLLSERATVAIGTNGHPRPQVTLERCVRTGL